MKNKINIKEVQLLLPDYITGSLDAMQKESVENAIKSNPEISKMYNEMKNAFEFVGSVKSEEPLPQYWTNLLPRIHERIEAKQERKLFNKPVPVIWRVLVPIAAIILIAILYKVVFISEKQYTEKKENIIQQEQPQEQPKEQLKEHENVIPKQNTNESKKEVSNDKENIEKIKTPRVHSRMHEPETIEPEKLAKEDDNDILKQKDNKLIDEFASLDMNDLTYITDSEAEGQSEEMENEVEKLNNKEKEDLIIDISNLNM